MLNVIRTAAQATDVSDGIRLELAPLLSLYGRNRRLSLRVERLPDRARLSRGRNNGDRSWSLMREDLDDLHYLPPDGLKSGHTLAIRIINLDTDDGATLAVLEFPVSPNPQQSPGRGWGGGPEIVDDPELARLREECSRVKDALGLREQELAEARQEIERARAEVLGQEKALAADRAAWQSEREGLRAGDPELPRLREECLRMAAALDTRERELTDARRQIEHTRGEAAKQENALSEARLAWQSELDSRLALSYAETSSRLEASRAAWQSELNIRIEESRARWQRDAEVALTRAKEAWKAEEASRLAQAEAQWREQSAHVLAEARTQAAQTESALARAEAEAARMSGDGIALRRLREELAEVNASLGARVRELAAARQSLEQARAEGLRGKSELAAARAAWQAEMERRLTEVRAESEAKRDMSGAEGPTEDHIEKTRERWRQESEAALARAQESWKAQEAVRFACAQAEWREQSARSLADSAARLEKLETALARAQAHALQESTDTVELRRVRDELAETRAVMLDREARLSQARLEMKRARERWKAESELALKSAHEAWKAEEAYRISVLRGDWQKDIRISRDKRETEESVQPRNTRRLVLDGCFAAALAVAVVVLYPTIAPMLAEYWPDAFAQATSDASVAAQPAVHPAHPAAPLPVPPQKVDVTVHAANVRATPSASAEIVTMLARGSKVTPLEQRGSWVRIQSARGNQTRQGWVYSAYLKDASGS